MPDVDVDVVVVGYGPTGQVLAALLGLAGHRVQVFERHVDPYPLPRAIHFDGDAMRLFDRLGIVEEIEREVYSPQRTELQAPDGEVLHTIPSDVPSPSGWKAHYSFYQPVLEDALRGVVAAQPSVSVATGVTVEAVAQGEGHVAVRARDADGAEVALHARFVVGADGANSVVREAISIPWEDREFSSPWVVADVRPEPGARVDHLPEVAMILDPVRPYVSVVNGRSYRRWEFLLTDEERDAGVDEEQMWALLAPHIAREDATLVRHAVYQFRSMLATSMQLGDIFLAGDSAHLMPPFAAQGMGCGIRDAQCLAWRLDLVLRGICAPALLAGYEHERRAQNESALNISIMNGTLVCNLDPEFIATRDTFLRATDELPTLEMPGLREGVTLQDAEGSDPVAGNVVPQGRVVPPGGTADRFDRVVGPGFALVCRTVDPTAVLSAERQAFLEAVGAHVVTLAPGSEASLSDDDGELTAWMAEHDLEAVITRPDFFAYGGVSSADELDALVDGLRDRLAYRGGDT